MGYSEREKLILEIRDDVEHGASELTVKAVYALIAAARLLRNESPESFNTEIQGFAEKLKSVRPSMAPLKNAVDRILTSSFEGFDDAEEVSGRITVNGERLIDNMRNAAEQIAVLAGGLILPGDTILIYSYSSTVIKTLNSIDPDYTLRVIVPRSGMAVSGFKAVKELDKGKFKITYIDDTALSLFAAESDKLITGADRICSDGTLINAAGTCLAAMAAKDEKVPVYVLCDSLKFDASITGDQAELEEKGISNMQIPPELADGIEIKNPFFDRTPSDLITAYITEDGIIDRKNIADYFRSLTG
jgi:ribose 1,5-bisphosphate isomerase